MEGKTSSYVPVVSGVPQGTVLGPMLFLTYINDLPKNVTSNTRLFADDSLHYRRIRTTGDHRILQENLSRLDTWERDWQAGLAGVLQPAEVRCHQDQQKEDSDNWLLYHPWSPTRHCQIPEVPWSHPYRQPLMECPCRPSYKEGQ